MKHVCSEKDLGTRMQTDWENIFANHMPYKGMYLD